MPSLLHEHHGFHTIHGRGAAIATGVKVANPKLCMGKFQETEIVWLSEAITSSIPIRNIDINIVLPNNRIYGLTKG